MSKSAYTSQMRAQIFTELIREARDRKRERHKFCQKGGIFLRSNRALISHYNEIFINSLDIENFSKF